MTATTNVNDLAFHIANYFVERDASSKTEAVQSPLQQPVSSAALFESSGGSAVMTRAAFQRELDIQVGQQLLHQVRRNAYLPNFSHACFAKAKENWAAKQLKRQQARKKQRTKHSTGAIPRGSTAALQHGKTVQGKTKQQGKKALTLSLREHVQQFNENHTLVFKRPGTSLAAVECDISKSSAAV